VKLAEISEDKAITISRDILKELNVESYVSETINEAPVECAWNIQIQVKDKIAISQVIPDDVSKDKVTIGHFAMDKLHIKFNPKQNVVEEIGILVYRSEISGISYGIKAMLYLSKEQLEKMADDTMRGYNYPLGTKEVVVKSWTESMREQQVRYEEYKRILKDYEIEENHNVTN